MSDHIDDDLNIRRATPADLDLIQQLAGSIWRESYPGMISTEQIEYMLTMMYSLDTMENEMAMGIRYDVAIVDGVLSGFASYGSVGGGTVKLHKLYLRKSLQGKGIGSRLLTHVINESQSRGYEAIVLNVNKGNDRAIAAYQRSGFAIREAVVVDIGGGFVMDDYVMERAL